MKKTYSIDLVKNKSLYHFTENDVTEDLIEDTLSDKTKGEIEEKTLELIKNGGFVLVPSTQLEQIETESALEQSKSRKQILRNILSDRPMPGLLGLINFKQAAIDKIEALEVTPSKTLESTEEYLEETLTIELKDGLDSRVEDLDIDLNIFGLNATETKGISEENQSDGSSKLDVISEAIFYNAAGREIHREFLIPETIADITQNGVVVNLNNQGHNAKNQRKSRKIISRLIKKIKIVVRKFVQKVRQVIETLKEGGITYILRGLKRLVGNRYKILKYNSEEKQFFDSDIEGIQSDKKTLVLLHGTLNGSIDGRLFKKKEKGKGSFKYLYDYKFKGFENWFDYLLHQKEELAAISYEQIIALEHETLLDDPEENIRVFFEELRFKDIKFDHPVSFVTASRGSLLSKQFSISPMAAVMDIERVAIVSGGYSDYFDSEKGVKQYINALTRLFPINKTLKFLLSLSIDLIMALPGLEVHNKMGERFPKLIKHRNNVCYFNMTNNYEGRKRKEKIFKRIANQFLGTENDFALGIAAQKDHRPGFTHSKFPDFHHDKRHGEALETEASKMALFYFLSADLTLPEDTIMSTV